MRIRLLLYRLRHKATSVLCAQATGIEFRLRLKAAEILRDTASRIDPQFQIEDITAANLMTMPPQKKAELFAVIRRAALERVGGR